MNWLELTGILVGVIAIIDVALICLVRGAK